MQVVRRFLLSFLCSLMIYVIQSNVVSEGLEFVSLRIATAIPNTELAN